VAITRMRDAHPRWSRRWWLDQATRDRTWLLVILCVAVLLVSLQIARYGDLRTHEPSEVAHGGHRLTRRSTCRDWLRASRAESAAYVRDYWRVTDRVVLERYPLRELADYYNRVCSEAALFRSARTISELNESVRKSYMQGSPLPRG
jgi:hypothetical protein